MFFSRHYLKQTHTFMLDKTMIIPDIWPSNSCDPQVQDLPAETLCEGPGVVHAGLHQDRQPRLPVPTVHDQKRGRTSLLCRIFCKSVVWSISNTKVNQGLTWFDWKRSCNWREPLLSMYIYIVFITVCSRRRCRWWR